MDDLRDDDRILRVLRRSRKSLAPGDVFVFCAPALDTRYFFGRVIRTDAVGGGFTGPHNLVYLYRDGSPDKAVPREFSPHRLLTPPLIVNRTPWTSGVFETLANVPLTHKDVLAQHCFYSLSRHGRCYDEYGNSVPVRSEPCGPAVLTPYPAVEGPIFSGLKELRGEAQ